MMERYGFERVPRRTTLTFRRNGRTVVAKRRVEEGQRAGNDDAYDAEGLAKNPSFSQGVSTHAQDYLPA